MNSHNTNNNDEYSLLTNIPQEVLGTKKLVKYTNYYRKSKQITISINPTCDTQTESKNKTTPRKKKITQVFQHSIPINIEREKNMKIIGEKIMNQNLST